MNATTNTQVPHTHDIFGQAQAVRPAVPTMCGDSEFCCTTMADATKPTADASTYGISCWLRRAHLHPSQLTKINFVTNEIDSRSQRATDQFPHWLWVLRVLRLDSWLGYWRGTQINSEVYLLFWMLSLVFITSRLLRRTAYVALLITLFRVLYCRLISHQS